MPRKIIIETDNIKDDIEEEFEEEFEQKFRDPFRKMHNRPPFGPERIIKKHVHMRVESEVKLFTDKSEMVTYVNQLKDIQNVEIFKIEDQLYKVLVTRRKKHEDCQGHHEGKHEGHHHEE